MDRGLSDKPPEGCKLRVGDLVVVNNLEALSFHPLNGGIAKIVGFPVGTNCAAVVWVYGAANAAAIRTCRIDRADGSDNYLSLEQLTKMDQILD